MFSGSREGSTSAGGSAHFMSISTDAMPSICPSKPLQYPRPVKAAFAGRDAGAAEGDAVRDELHRILAFRPYADMFEPNAILAASPSLPSRERMDVDRRRQNVSPSPAMRIPGIVDEGAQAPADMADIVTPPSRAANPIVCNSPFLGGGSEEDLYVGTGAEIGIFDLSPPPRAEYMYAGSSQKRGRVTAVAQPRRTRSISCPEGGGLICGTA
eukprot:CAMPEP_0114631786 /NCGR_PEP_ID=MMETSP0168-20121206/14594_1 /TAXON_ID=95228 ORGANISM="Vannella sp., Strain DIVA3 517/6/12" /NCGR_SAMPLE_ID=MMETSP0168 /ASSEMBLY_ACC=CAM_ASM_000044 /LENGTH=211 /DNA_ID=CAMNT_0001843367 /DNA_START=103 /DNA_END=738 /DNA_ORIENTATION=+